MLLNKYNWKIYQKFLNVFSATKDEIEKLIAISNDLFVCYGVLFVFGIRAVDLYSLPLPAVGFLLAMFSYTPCCYVKQALNPVLELKEVGKTLINSRNAHVS